MSTNDETLSTLKAIEKHLKTLIRINHFLLKKQAFENDLEQSAFDLIGVKKRNEICDYLHISPNTLSELCNKWASMGLLVKEGNSYQKTTE